MNVPHEPRSSSQSLIQWLQDQPVRDFTWEPWQLRMVESFQQAITERRLAHRTAPTRRLRCVSVRFTLRPTWLPTPPGTEYPSSAARSMLLTRPAILALASSLTQVYDPWFFIADIETTPDSDF